MLSSIWKIETMTTLSFTSYPIRNKYEYYLPELQLFSSYNVGGIALKDLNIYTEPSYYDGHSDDHRFNTFHSNSITNHDEAWAIGLELVSILRGLITIFYGENKQSSVRLEKMKIEGQPVEYPTYQMNHNIKILLGFYQRLGSNLISNLTFTERRDYKESAKANVFASSFYIAQTHIGLYLILKYFSEPLTWMSLYKIMETFMTIEAHHDTNWKIPYSKADKTRFTNPANDFSMVGIDARHGFKKDSLMPNSGPKMEINEAKEMFINCAQSYLNFKLDELRKAP